MSILPKQKPRPISNTVEWVDSTRSTDHVKISPGASGSPSVPRVWDKGNRRIYSNTLPTCSVLFLIPTHRGTGAAHVCKKQHTAGDARPSPLAAGTAFRKLSWRANTENPMERAGMLGNTLDTPLKLLLTHPRLWPSSASVSTLWSSFLRASASLSSIICPTQTQPGHG